VTNFAEADERSLLREAAPVSVGFIETLERLQVPIDQTLVEKDREAAAAARRARESYRKWKDSLTNGQQNVTHLADTLDSLLNAVGTQGLILVELKEMLRPGAPPPQD
jgi:hypothetical protein